MKIQILTIFPRICEGCYSESMLKRAQEKGLATLEALDLRDWATDRHRTTDDAPYGGGPGMVMKIEPIARALDALRGRGNAGPLDDAPGADASIKGWRRPIPGRAT